MVEERETVITIVAKDVEERAVASGQACLVAFYGGNIGKRFFLAHAEIIIGRSDSANIQVDQDSVSRQHAKITARSGRTWLHDLDSTNGTFVNDQAVADYELQDGDLIRIGQTIFKYLSGSNIESKYHEEIYRLTTIDGLTQAFNRRYLLESLERELHRVARYGHQLALTMCDIDHFKRINDTHGHLAGVYVLREPVASLPTTSGGRMCLPVMAVKNSPSCCLRSMARRPFRSQRSCGSSSRLTSSLLPTRSFR